MSAATSRKPTRPMLRYHGGKWRLAPWIIEHMPEHRVYVEPFGGGAGVLLQKPVVETEIYNDRDREVVNLFRVLRDEVLACLLAERLHLTPFSRAEFNAAYEVKENAAPLDRAWATLVKSFMGMGSKGIWIKSGFDTRVNPDGFVSRLNAFRKVGPMMDAFAGRLSHVILEEGPAVPLIDRLAERTDTLFYVDPPYVKSSYGGENVYRHRMTDDDHRELAASLNRVRGGIMLSGYPSPLYQELYAGWDRIESGALADAGESRTEVLWLRNVPTTRLL